MLSSGLPHAVSIATPLRETGFARFVGGGEGGSPTTARKDKAATLIHGRIIEASERTCMRGPSAGLRGLEYEINVRVHITGTRQLVLLEGVRVCLRVMCTRHARFSSH